MDFSELSSVLIIASDLVWSVSKVNLKPFLKQVLFVLTNSSWLPETSTVQLNFINPVSSTQQQLIPNRTEELDYLISIDELRIWVVAKRDLMKIF